MLSYLNAFFFKFWAPKYTRFLHFHYIQEKADISAAKIWFWNKHQQSDPQNDDNSRKSS